MKNYIITNGTDTYEVRVPDKERLKVLVKQYLKQSLDSFRVVNLSESEELRALFEEGETNKYDDRCFIIKDNGRLLFMEGRENKNEK